MKRNFSVLGLVLVVSMFFACASAKYNKPATEINKRQVEVKSYNPQDMIPASLADYNSSVAGFIDGVTWRTIEDGKVPEGATEFVETVVPAGAPNIKKTRHEYSRTHKGVTIRGQSPPTTISRGDEIRRAWTNWRRANPNDPLPKTTWPPGYKAINWRQGDTGGR